MATHKVAQGVRGLDRPIPIYTDGRLVAHLIEGRFTPIVSAPKVKVERVPYANRRLRYRDREYEEGVTCYFIGGETGPVKIGFTDNLERRLKALQAASPVMLSVLATTGGGIFAELAYHERFADDRLHGEWFNRSPSILAEIDILNHTQGGSANG